MRKVKKPRKLLIKRIGNNEKYNEIDLEKSDKFFNNLQNFVINAGIVNKKECTYESNEENDETNYDGNTFYTLFPSNCKDGEKKKKIKDIENGSIVRYYNKEIELLIIFLNERIKLVFYCNQEKRKKIMAALFKFCEFAKWKFKEKKLTK